MKPARVTIDGAKPTAVSATSKKRKAAAERSRRTSRCRISREFGPASEKPHSVDAAERTNTSAGGSCDQNQRRWNSSAKPEPTMK